LNDQQVIYYEVGGGWNNTDLTNNDFDSVIDTALDRLVEFADAEGGIFTLYNNKMVKDSWEYVILKGITAGNDDLSKLMNLIDETFVEGSIQNYKQPNFAPEYNNIILTGGCALNCTSNMKLYATGLFTNIYIPPFPGDEGISLGLVGALINLTV